MVALVSAYRYNGEEINAKLAKNEAEILHEAIKDKAFNNDEVIRILSTRSKAQLTATFNRYRDDQGISITKVQLKLTSYKIFHLKSYLIKWRVMIMLIYKT